MSGRLESALVIELVDTIKWGAALAPTSVDGSLTPVDFNRALDITKYSRRDRELAYRDLVNATAVVKVSLHVESVWNTASIRPKLQGATSGVLPTIAGDLGAVNSTVVHVKNSSLPKDAVATDKDLAGRDAVIYETLARACQVFEQPPLAPLGTSAPSTSAWSLAEGVDYNVVPSPSMPLNRDLFYKSDVSLAQRDNYIAAYASRLAEILKNPFAFASRLYIRVDGADARDAEVYSIIRPYFKPGGSYDSGAEVYYGTKWYRAKHATSDVPTSAEWEAIESPRYREWTAEPALPFRNRIIYDTLSKTLQWFRETTDTAHVPQIFAMSIPGMFDGQTINMIAQVPERKDSQYWRQKAARIDYSGTTAELAYACHDTTQIGSGLHMSDSIGLTAPNTLSVPLGIPVYAGHKYRLSALVKPVNEVTFDGNRNLLGLTGVGSGVTFSGPYAPTLITPGRAVNYSVQLPAGTWYLSVNYTNLSGTTSGFGLKITLDDRIISDATVPLLFQDAGGNALPVGTPVQSAEWQLNTDGTADILSFILVYGPGSFQINSISLRTSDRLEAEYFIKAEVCNTSGNGIYFGDAPTIESTGRKNVYEALHWDFTVTKNATTPQARITWMSSSDLPIQFRKFSLAEIKPTFATPGVTGYDGFKWDCLRRAERSIQAAFSGATLNLPDVSISTGGVWSPRLTEEWMALIETHEKRLRQVEDVQTVSDGFQYSVAGGHIVYNSGTYYSGDVFNGTSSASTYLDYGASVNQVGAFRKAAPVDMGHPVLMPLGLRFDEASAKIVMDNEANDQVPTVVACQPWMVEAGLYAADEDFRAGDTAASSPDTVTINAVASPPEGGSVVGSGRYPMFQSVVLTAVPGASVTQFTDFGVDIAVVLDESGSMAPARPYIQSLFSQLDSLFISSGIGKGALTNRYALVGFSGSTGAHTAVGHVDFAFGSFSAFNSYIGALGDIFTGAGEDGYSGLDAALTNLSWRLSDNVVKILILVTDEDRNVHYYTNGGPSQEQQFFAILGQIAAKNAMLVTMTRTGMVGAGGVSILGFKYGGKSYVADGSGGFTTGVGGYATGPSNPGDTASFPTGSLQEYVELAQYPAIRGSSWNFQLVRTGGNTALSLQKAMVSSIAEDVAFAITRDWVFSGWYNQNGVFLSSSPTYAFTATESQTITGRFSLA